MIARKPLAVVMIIFDRHKKDTDFQTIRGFCNAVSAVSDDIEEVVKRRNVTHILGMGDLYHRGYRKQDAQYVDTHDDFRLSRMVNGNYYEVAGNHLLKERDANPEFYLIQPNTYPDLQPISNRKFKEQVIKLVDELVIGPVQFSFFHFNKTNKNYIRERHKGIKYHIGLYHDDEVVPNSIRKACGMQTEVRSEYINKIYDNIDVGFLGHIHTKLGKKDIILPTGRRVPLFIQGALAITSSTISEFHKSVDTPILTIYEDSCKISFEPISLHTEMLAIYREEDKIPTANKEVYRPKEEKPQTFKVAEEFKGTAIKCTSFHDYIARIGLEPKYGEIFDIAKEDKLSNEAVDAVLGRWSK